MTKYEYISLREKSEIKDLAAEWFHSKWGVPTEAYLECMDAYLCNETEYGWYLCLSGNQIIGGMGVFENDFHDRKDLTPNVCAVFTEEGQKQILKQHNNLQVRFSLFNERIGYVGVLIAWR